MQEPYNGRSYKHEAKPAKITFSHHLIKGSVLSG
jgi:hypothetical protein